MKSVSVFVLLVMGLCHVMCDLSTQYNHHAMLDEFDKFNLYWTVEKDLVKFAVEVETTGWIGLGISTGTGKMAKADVVMGWVKDGKGFIQDRYAEGYYLPTLDSQQDVKLTAFKEEAGKTTLEFNRKTNTCDKKDHPIEEGTVRFIWAYHDQDPDTETSGFAKHSTKGSRSVMLLNSYSGNAALPSDSVSYEFLNNKAVVPDDDTTYWCQPFKLPDFGGKKHIVQIDPVIQSGHEGIVHHTVLYVCNDQFPESDLSFSGPCEQPNMPGNITGCRKAIMYAWAIGAGNFSFPEHVGFALGETDSPKFLMLETHYDNPQLRNDVVDSSGIRLHLTSQLRTHDCDMLITGAIVNEYATVVPPKQKAFLVESHCTKECTKQAIPEGGINIFAVMPHTHLVGYSVRARHFKEGKELPSIIRDDNYDFNFQEYQYLVKEKNIQPGDEIITDCRYNTMAKTLATVGGESTRQEMCFAFMLYYPRTTKFGACTSAGGKIVELAKKYLKYENNSFVKEWTDISPWPESLTSELQDAYMGDGKVTMNCGGVDGKIPGMKAFVTYHDKVKVSQTLSEKDVCDTVSGAPVLEGLLSLTLLCLTCLAIL